MSARFRPRFRFGESYSLLQKAARQGQVFSNGGTRSSQERGEQRLSRWSPKSSASSTLVVREGGRSLLGDGRQRSSLLLLLVLHVLRRFRRRGSDQGGRQGRLSGQASEGVKAYSLDVPAVRQGVGPVIRPVHRVNSVGEAELHHRHPPHGHPPRVAWKRKPGGFVYSRKPRFPGDSPWPTIGIP